MKPKICYRERNNKANKLLHRERDRVSNLVFYAQSTITVISGRKRDREYGWVSKMP